MFLERNPLYEKYKSLKSGIYTIEGIIGAGKTTLGKSLESFLNDIGIKAKFFPEYVNHTLLSQYIGDMKKYAYAFQLAILFKRIETYKEAEKYAKKGRVALIDRSIIGDMTFARMQKDNGNFTEDEWKTYLSILQQEIQLSPTASIYLKCTSETALQRIYKRGIESEVKGYSIEYLDQLNTAYEMSINECTTTKHIIIDWNDTKDTEETILILDHIKLTTM